jgi:cGMP-dependent protein kinase
MGGCTSRPDLLIHSNHSAQPPNNHHNNNNHNNTNTETKQQYIASENSTNDNDRPQQHDFTALLKTIPLLSKLSSSDISLLNSALIEKEFPPGSIIIKEGDIGNEFYLIKSGTARVTKYNSESNSDVELCSLRPLDYCGEQALINNGKRMASITSIGTVVALSMSSEKFQSLFGSNRLNITFAKRAAVSAETYDPKENKNNQAIHSSSPSNTAIARNKSADQRDMILTVVKSSLLFKSLGLEQQLAIVDEMWIKNIAANETIIKQGDLGDYWYIVESGHFDIYVQKKGSAERLKVAQRERATAFGELALMYNAPRAATVIATVTSAVWVLDRSTARKLLTTVTDQKLREYEQFLRGVNSFQMLLENERSKIAEALEEISYPANHYIVKQGDMGDSFFILKRGEVVVTKVDIGTGEESEVAHYNPGDSFGERALLTNDVRAANCISLTPVTCLYLNRDAFNLLLGPMEDMFQRRLQGYGSNSSVSPINIKPLNLSPGPAINRVLTVQSGMIEQNTESYLDLSISLSDLIVVGTLGKGSFGHVQLVRHAKSNKTYALKTVSKVQIVQLGQQEHIINEKKAMAQLNHPFLIKLHATFKDKNCLYFLLEVSLGGELFSVLRAKTLFDESTARFYAAGVILAFDYMHSKGIIYRDLKPENLLLDAEGYIKIVDFGFAKKVGDNRTWTLCGTPDYLAPEVVSGAGHGKGVDWWCLGILIYEMLASYPPFYDDDPMKTYTKIMAGQLVFPMHFSKNAVDLIKRLLHPKATKRLGVITGGAKLIKEHPWFNGFDWNSFAKKKLAAPIILPVKSSEDLSNFESYPDENNPIEDYAPDSKHPQWDEEF